MANLEKRYSLVFSTFCLDRRMSFPKLQWLCAIFQLDFRYMCKVLYGCSKHIKSYKADCYVVIADFITACWKDFKLKRSVKKTWNLLKIMYWFAAPPLNPTKLWPLLPCQRLVVVMTLVMLTLQNKLNDFGLHFGKNVTLWKLLRSKSASWAVWWGWVAFRESTISDIMTMSHSVNRRRLMSSTGFRNPSSRPPLGATSRGLY